ncbi:MAG TPA: hypothetical protein VFB32_11555 [Rudaea sp.]|nr:hypothetical protein [Rudaea sp.]
MPISTHPRAYRAVAAFALAALSNLSAATPPERDMPRFPPAAIWNQDISGVTADTNSAAMIGASVAWGTNALGNTSFQIDFSMHILYSSWGSNTIEPLVKKAGYYNGECDDTDSVPLPAGGAIEGVTNYTCSGGDCHLFVVDGSTLYEAYNSTVDASGIHALCLVKWHLNEVYPANGRGDRCTSADAAGYPMAPLITTPDEVWHAIPANGGTGNLGHALRFVLDNSRIRPGFYVHPATHSGVPNGTGPTNAIPYGARLRLHALFSETGYNPAAQVILETLKKYGMFLADGGGIPLTFSDDMFTTHHWSDADINIDSHSLFGPRLQDFDVMPIGTPVQYDDNNDTCVLNPDDVIFADGYNW